MEKMMLSNAVTMPENTVDTVLIRISATEPIPVVRTCTTCPILDFQSIF